MKSLERRASSEANHKMSTAIECHGCKENSDAARGANPKKLVVESMKDMTVTPKGQIFNEFSSLKIINKSHAYLPM
jgi:hypothetical protein